MRESPAREMRAERNVGAATINAAYDTLHGVDSATATNNGDRYESLHLEHTPSETDVAVP